VASSNRCNDATPPGSVVVDQSRLIAVVAVAVVAVVAVVAATWTVVVVVWSWLEEDVDVPAHAETIRRPAPRIGALILTPVRRSMASQSSYAPLHPIRGT
jgi:hypothetical protein